MRRSWSPPIATVGMPVQIDAMLAHRKSTNPKPGPALYALRALALALAEQPNAAARLIGNRAVRSDSIDIGLAVEAQDGIMVPVIRSADKTSLGDLTNQYTELVDLARRRRSATGFSPGRDGPFLQPDRGQRVAGARSRESRPRGARSTSASASGGTATSLCSKTSWACPFWHPAGFACGVVSAEAGSAER